MSDSNAWAEQWLKAQQEMVESWSDMAKSQSPASSNQSADMWSNGFDMWRKAYTTPSNEADQVINKCMDIGKGYFAMAEQIGKQISAGGKPQDVVQQWLEQIKSGIHHENGHEFMSQWMGPSANWQKMTAATLPVNMPGSTSGVYGIGEDYDKISQILSMPGIGFFRESQEKQQEAHRLAQEYMRSNQKFNASFMQVSVESLQAFQEKLAAIYDNDNVEHPSSMRAIYDLWVDISEAHYANYAMSEEYQSLYGDMVNKLMQLKQHCSNLVDETLESLNLPSRKELDTLHQRLQETRRENRQLRQELKEIRALLGKKKSPVKKAAVKKSAKTKKTSRKTGA